MSFFTEVELFTFLNVTCMFKVKVNIDVVSLLGREIAPPDRDNAYEGNIVDLTTPNPIRQTTVGYILQN